MKVVLTRTNVQRSTPRGSAFCVGEKVEGRFRGKGRWYKGRIIGVNPDGTYDVRYEDGDEDLHLDASAVRSAAAAPRAHEEPARDSSRHSEAAPVGRNLRVGNKVQVRVPGSTRWEKATIVSENRDGTIDVRLLDGTEEKRLSPSFVRALDEDDSIDGGSGGSRGRSRTSGETYRVGEDVEARYRGSSKWYRGVVRRVNEDGTYDVRYADGDQETAVVTSLMRPAPSNCARDTGGSVSDTDSVLANKRVKYHVGDKIEAKFGGRSRWYGATIQRKNRDGTFHLLYEDGDEERAVDQQLMRTIDRRDGGGQRSGSKSPGRRVVSGASSETDLTTHRNFRPGDKVEARYKRGRTWYTGTIRAVGRDGTYDIRYEDGDTEESVDPGIVRGIGVGSTDSLASAKKRGARGSGKDFLEGEKVEARFGGRSRWYKATVQRLNRDCTCHLLYEDGDEEKNVENDMIRKCHESDQQDSKSSESRTSSHGHAAADSVNNAAAGRRKIGVGDKVEGRYKGGHRWYPGVVQAIHCNGTYDIRYNDGDTEREVAHSLVRGKGVVSVDSLEDTAALTKGEFVRGDKVEARLGGRSRWFRATVERENRDGTYHLLYEDGDEERIVERDLMRRTSNARVPSGANRGSPDRHADSMNREGKDYRMGDEVEARYRRGHKWSPGVVRAANPDGTCDILYKNGASEYNVDRELIRGTGRSSVDSFGSSELGGARNLRTKDYTEGQRVEARFGGLTRWFKATVERKNRDGTYFLVYADGDKERAVSKDLIRKIGAERPESVIDEGVSSAGTFRVGDEIESRYKKGHKWYPGEIRAVNRSGTYDIRYNDGDSEYDVDASFIRAAEAKAFSGPVPRSRDRSDAGVDFVEGDCIEAKFRGGSRWFKAEVARANRDGTFHLLYVDGDEEKSVPKSLMRKLGRVSDALQERSKADRPGDLGGGRGGDVYRIGEDIEARFRGGHKWYVGVVRATNRDGSYDIRYSDGDTEREIDPSLMRRRGGASTASLASSADDDFLEGDNVEARRGGRSRWLRARVHRKRRDGTYDVRYEDDREERSVRKHLIRKLGSRTAVTSSVSRSKSPGRRVASDDTVDVDPDFTPRGAFSVGDDVEARYKGGRKWYPGVLRTANHDGTFDILYKDGDDERGVQASSIRGVTSASSQSRVVDDGAAGALDRDANDEFRAGDKVEARFSRGSRWFLATVERKNRDGTYHLLYDDGDEERNVSNGFIRRIERRRSAGRSPDRQAVSGDYDSVPVVNDGSRSRLREGDHIEVWSRHRRMWQAGVVQAENRDGTYDVRYKDGQNERFVDRSLLRSRNRDVIEPLASDLDENGYSFLSGDKVEARLGGRSRWYKATVERKNRDGTYHLVYVDGDEERRVERDLIRKRGEKVGEGDSRTPIHAKARANSAESNHLDDEYRVGDQVEARFGGKSRWYRATVERKNADNSYSLLYVDGDRERAVDKELMRSLARSGKGKDTDDRTSEDYIDGDDVEARYKRGRKWYSGRIRAVNGDGTYDVLYGGGGSERGVDRALVRRIERPRREVPIHSDAEETPGVVFAVGDDVDARFGRGSRWFKATIKHKNRDGTYHLLYADGDEEEGVEKSLMRRTNQEDGARYSRGAAKRSLSVEENSGTDVEEAKASSRRGVRSLSPKGRDQAHLQIGDKIEARAEGDLRWRPGAVSRVHRDGTCDILYADGQADRGVAASYVRRQSTKTKRSQNRTDSESDLTRRAGDNEGSRDEIIVKGDRVEARPLGRSSWQTGKVVKVHSDGTYDVSYKNGQMETRVERRLVRLPRSNGTGGVDDGSVLTTQKHARVNASRVIDESGGPRHRGRLADRSPPWQHFDAEDAEAAARKIRRALRDGGKTADYLTLKLEREQRADNGNRKDSRGHSLIGRTGVVHSDALNTVLASIGVNLSSRHLHAISRCCADRGKDRCINLSTLSSTIQKGVTSTNVLIPRKRSSGSRSRAEEREHRHLPSGNSQDSSGSVGTVNRMPNGSRAARGRRGSIELFSDGSRSSDTDRPGIRGLSSQQGSSVGRKLRSTDWNADSMRRSSSVRGRTISGAGLREDTSSESGRGHDGDMSSEGSEHTNRLVGRRAFIAFQKLEGTAFDGSLRQEFQKLHSGRGRALVTADIGR